MVRYEGRWCERAFLRVRTTAVVGAVLVPVVTNVVALGDYRSLVTTIITLIVSIVVALESVYHFGDQF